MARLPRLRRERPINASTPSGDDAAPPEREEEPEQAKAGDAVPETSADSAATLSTPPAAEAEGSEPGAEKLSRRQRRRAEKLERAERKAQARAEAETATAEVAPETSEADPIPDPGDAEGEAKAKAKAEAEAKTEAKIRAKAKAKEKAAAKAEKADAKAKAAKAKAAMKAERRQEKAASRKSRRDGTSLPKRRRVSRRAAVAAGVLGIAAIAAGLVALGAFDSDRGARSGPPPSPVPVLTTPAPSGEPGSPAAANLGFPAIATRNTTRVGGRDSAANAAAVALATFPSTGGSRSPLAVSLVADGDWQSGIAASSLAAAPLSVPVLITSADGVPGATERALGGLAPRGGALTGGTQAFTIGEASAPEGLREQPLIGADPTKLAAAIDRLRGELTGSEPAHVLVTSSEASEYAMPAAGWAARSGDPVLFTDKKKLPAATAKALKSHENVPVYVLGPPAVIPESVLRQISAAAGAPAVRISGTDPVANAIAFASFGDGDFGWNINDPGHGFVVARSDRPLDAAAAAPLSASGTWGPLLLTDSTDTLPGALRGYLRKVQPGYRNDPTRALYNHVWVIGDEEAISLAQQAAIDDLAELTQIGPPPPPPSSGPTAAAGSAGAKGTTGKPGATGTTGPTGASGGTGGGL